ncbi:MAG TPA: ribonuclease III, partial [Firmicutes bacterium]|nr:ribonuclease III [Bacillota bacterium]
FAASFAVLDKGELRKDYKTFMQEYAQEKFSLTPTYRIVDETGPDHDKTFTAQFLLEDKVWGEGKGKSKKEAEQEAASAAFKKLVG